jgi:hypothetical protein
MTDTQQPGILILDRIEKEKAVLNNKIADRIINGIFFRWRFGFGTVSMKSQKLSYKPHFIRKLQT